MDPVRVVRLPPDEATLRLLLELDRLSFREDLRYGEAEFRRRLGLPGAEVLAADADGARVGVALCERRADEVFLDVLAVHPSSRGRGVGRLLVEAVLSWAHQAGANMVRVHAERRDQAGVDLVRFYARAGFRVEEDHDGWVALMRPVEPRRGGARPPG